jgi:hypothetical protein
MVVEVIRVYAHDVFSKYFTYIIDSLNGQQPIFSGIRNLYYQRTFNIVALSAYAIPARIGDLSLSLHLGVVSFAGIWSRSVLTADARAKPLAAAPSPSMRYPRGRCFCRLDRTLEETYLASERGWRMAVNCLDIANNDGR